MSLKRCAFCLGEGTPERPYLKDCWACGGSAEHLFVPAIDAVREAIQAVAELDGGNPGIQTLKKAVVAIWEYLETLD